MFRKYIGRSNVHMLRYRMFSSQTQFQLNDTEWRNALPYEKIPGPSTWTLLAKFLPGGEFHGLQYDELHTLWRQRYGDLIKIPGTFGRKDLLVSCDPRMFEKILRTEGPLPVRNSLDTVKHHRLNYCQDIYGNTMGVGIENGEKWFEIRKKINPIFLQSKATKMYVGKTDQVVREFVDLIREIRDPVTLEAPNTFGKNLKRWALESIGVIALDKRLGALRGETEESQKMIKLVEDFFALSTSYEIAPPVWKYYRTKGFFKLMKIYDEVTDIAMQYIDDKIKILQASEASNQSDRSILEKFLEVNREMAIVTAIDMLTAGIDTTAASLTSCLYHLAKNPEKQEILRQEVMRILPERSSTFSIDSLNNIPYMRACFKEAVRLNPIAVGTARSTGQDLVLNGYQVPKNTDILMSMALIQRSEKYFKNSMEFIPERWVRGTEQHIPNIDPFIYLPFGFGPRSCIGRRFAEMEIFIVLIRFLREFKMEYHYGPLKYDNSIIFNPNEDLKFKFIDLEK